MITPVEICVRSISDDTDIARGAAFALAHPDGYDTKQQGQWIEEKYVPRLSDGDAFGLLVYYGGLKVVADSLVYIDPEKQAGEIKHFRVADNYADQGLGAVAWRQSELIVCRALGLQSGQAATLKLDTRADNLRARRFFESRGCQQIGQAALYELGVVDVLYEKTIRPPRAAA